MCGLSLYEVPRAETLNYKYVFNGNAESSRGYNEHCIKKTTCRPHQSHAAEVEVVEPAAKVAAQKAAAAKVAAGIWLQALGDSELQPSP